MTEHKMRVITLGRLLGTATGWDGDPGECFWFYDFEPAPGVALAACASLNIDLLKGEVIAQDKEGNAIGEAVDIVALCAELPRVSE